MPRQNPVGRTKPTKSERERAVLLGLVELYIKTGTPVGSNTLKDYGFADLSSATIRNYFAALEKEGYLIQHHASGGRIPHERAYKLYAHTHKEATSVSSEDELFLQSALEQPPKQINTYLQQSLDALSELTGSACFMLAPRFDQDCINEVKLVSLDSNRLLCVLMTDFGFVHTETIYSPAKLSSFSIKRLESYFRHRITQSSAPNLSKEEGQFATQIYNEVILRHIIAYSNFDREDIYKSGFSRLLNHREFKDTEVLSSSLSLFESSSFVRSLLNDCFRSGDIKFWIDSDLQPFMRATSGASLIAVPYHLYNSNVGALAILGPDRLDYPRHFALLKQFSEQLSQALTQTLYKFKISYRNPHPNHFEIASGADQRLIENQNLQESK